MKKLSLTDRKLKEACKSQSSIYSLVRIISSVLRDEYQAEFIREMDREGITFPYGVDGTLYDLTPEVLAWIERESCFLAKRYKQMINQGE